MYLIKNLFITLLLLLLFLIFIGCTSIENSGEINENNQSAIENEKNRENLIDKEANLEEDSNDNNKEDNISYKEITDEKIQEELQFIQGVLQVNDGKKEIEKAFDDKYHKYIISRDALDAPNKQGLNDVHFYIFNNSSKLLNFEVGEFLFEDGIIIETKENSIIVEYNYNQREYFEEFFYNDMDLFVENLLLKRKSGIRIEILYSSEDTVLTANIFYINEENKVNTISYKGNGTIIIYENVTREEHYKSF